MNREQIAAEIIEYLEGLADPAATELTARRLETDPVYAEVHAELQAIDQQLAEAPPTPSAGFTRRVAAHLRQEGRWPWWTALRRLLEHLTITAPTSHPVVSLIESRAARARRQLPGPILLALIFGWPGLLFRLDDELSQLSFLMVAAGCLLVALPWYYFKTDVDILRSLRQGRCLEDLLCAGVDGRGMVDTLAVHSLRSIVKVAVPCLLIMLPSVLVLPERYAAKGLVCALGWLPAVMLAFYVGSYVTQFQTAWSRRGESVSAIQLGVLVATLLPVLGLGWVSAYLFGLEFYAEGAMALVCSGALLTLASRSLAIWGLENARTIDRWNELGRNGGYRNPTLAVDDENPIVLRYQARMAAGTPGGWLGRAAAETWIPLIGLAWLGVSLLGQNYFWWGLLIVLAVGWLQAALTTLAAVVDEREANTWETLLQTGLDLETFRTGWLEVATRGSWARQLPAAVTPLALAVLHPHYLAGDGSEVLAGMVAWAACWLVLIAPRFGAQVGLAVSATVAGRRVAGSRLVAAVLFGLIGWLLAWGGLAFVGMLTAEAGFVYSGGDNWEALIQRVFPLLSLALVGWLVERRGQPELAASGLLVPEDETRPGTLWLGYLPTLAALAVWAWVFARPLAWRLADDWDYSAWTMVLVVCFFLGLRWLVKPQLALYRHKTWSWPALVSLPVTGASLGAALACHAELSAYARWFDLGFLHYGRGAPPDLLGIPAVTLLGLLVGALAAFVMKHRQPELTRAGSLSSLAMMAWLGLAAVGINGLVAPTWTFEPELARVVNQPESLHDWTRESESYQQLSQEFGGSYLFPQLEVWLISIDIDLDALSDLQLALLERTLEDGVAGQPERILDAFRNHVRRLRQVTGGGLAFRVLLVREWQEFQRRNPPDAVERERVLLLTMETQLNRVRAEQARRGHR
ncbi:MAG: hypothetical protein AB7S38_24620 [Vulcanimicrobiota bacterium]